LKSGFVSIVGRPNAGKSTLLNLLLEDKIAITTSTPQTTRNVIKGIYTDQRGQIVLLDTPGIHLEQHDLGQLLNTYAIDAIDSPDIDVVIYIVDVTREIKEEESKIIELINKLNKPVILLINKMDLNKAKSAEELKSQYFDKIKYKNFLAISAKDVKYREQILELIFESLGEGPMYYPEDQLADYNMRFLAAEIIREQVILNSTDEVPHAVAVQIDKYTEYDDMVEIEAIINVERNTQKQIIIGKNGQKIKQIKHFSKKNLKKIIELPVQLSLFVKVKPKWRKNKKFLKDLGYE
jgi:GTPase